MNMRWKWLKVGMRIMTTGLLLLALAGCVSEEATPKIVFDPADAVVVTPAGTHPPASPPVIPQPTATPTAEVYYIQGSDAPLPPGLIPPTPWYLGTPTEFWRSPTPPPPTATPTAPTPPLTALARVTPVGVMITPTPYTGPAFTAEGLRLGPEISLTADMDGIWNPTWLPDNVHVIFNRTIVPDILENSYSGIWLLNTSTRELQEIVERGYEVTLSPDGRQVAYIPDRESPETWVVSLETGQAGKWAGGTPKRWLDNEQLLATDPNDRLMVLKHGQAAQSLDASRQPLAISPDGVRLMRSSGNGGRQVINRATGRYVSIASGDLQWVEAVAWAPEGHALAYLLQEGPGCTVWVIDEDKLQPRQVVKFPEHLRGPCGEVIGWSPDGNVIFFTKREFPSPIGYNAYAVNVDGSQLRLLVRYILTGSLRWSSDNTKMIFVQASLTEMDKYFLSMVTIEVE